MSAERCTQCTRTISAGRPVDPVTYLENTFCDERCASRWAYRNMPLVDAAAKEAKYGLRRILIHARGRGRELARDTLNNLTEMETT